MVPAQCVKGRRFYQIQVDGSHVARPRAWIRHGNWGNEGPIDYWLTKKEKLRTKGAALEASVGEVI